MKRVMVHPERCVGCMQCMPACATAHSKTRHLFAAIMETPLPQSRIHVGVGRFAEGFPNRCRHCDPAPCQIACLPGAIYRDPVHDTVLVDADICINCASCAMACPFGVLRYHEIHTGPTGKSVAVKCDNCLERQAQGLVPACVDACKSGALTFEETAEAMKRKTDEVARRTSSGTESDLSPTFSLLQAMKHACIQLQNR